VIWTGGTSRPSGNRHQPALKVLFPTGYARNAIFHHERLDKGVRLVTKLFTLNDLATKVRDVLDALART
jgi:hypothetical protein